MAAKWTLTVPIADPTVSAAAEHLLDNLRQVEHRGVSELQAELTSVGVTQETVRSAVLRLLDQQAVTLDFEGNLHLGPIATSHR